MRWVAVVGVLACRVAAAGGGIADPEAVRPELVSASAATYAADGALRQREERIYDATGHLTRDLYRKPDGSELARWDYTWDSGGRLASHKTHDGAGQLVMRVFAYKLDGKGRIAVRTMRDPNAPAGEYYLDVFTWAGDGSHAIQTERHYPKEGPYKSDYSAFDAQGKLTRQCAEHGGCSMYEYDPRGNLTRVREQPAGGEHFYRVYETTYDAAGRIAKLVIGGTTTEYRYNTRGDVIEAIASTAGKRETRTVYSYVYR